MENLWVGYFYVQAFMLWTVELKIIRHILSYFAVWLDVDGIVHLLHRFELAPYK